MTVHACIGHRLGHLANLPGPQEDLCPPSNSLPFSGIDNKPEVATGYDGGAYNQRSVLSDVGVTNTTVNKNALQVSRCGGANRERNAPLSASVAMPGKLSQRLRDGG